MSEALKGNDLNKVERQIVNRFRELLKKVIDSKEYTLDLSGSPFPDSVDIDKLKELMVKEGNDEDVDVFFKKPDVNYGTMVYDTVSYGKRAEDRSITWHEESEAR